MYIEFAQMYDITISESHEFFNYIINNIKLWFLPLSCKETNETAPEKDIAELPLLKPFNNTNSL